VPSSPAADQAQAAHSVLAGAGLRAGTTLQTAALFVSARARPDGSSSQALITTGICLIERVGNYNKNSIIMSVIYCSDSL